MSDPTTTTDDTDETQPAMPKHRFGIAALLATALLALLVGVSVGFVAPQLTRPGDDSAEAGFLRDMSNHHAQAVEMAMIAFDGSTVPDIKTLGNDIALTQHGQVNIMKTWLREWGLNPTGTQPAMAWMPDAAGSVRDGLMPGMATQQQMASLRAATGKQLDVQFLELMRQHHLGGIHMAQEIIELSDNEDVTWIAGTMVATQQGELNVISDLLIRVKAAP
ncbi:MAG TPA: DUF305 domain-containing protein [Actinoplanes sp.]|jgi:uncharacterized protein (DUF305 family)